MDRLDAMRMVVRVSELGSFSAAARQLDLARSVVTRQVAALEAHLSVKLFARTTRRLTPTSAGAAYIEKCRAILTLVEAAETDLAQEHQTPRGPIRISLPLSFGVRHLSPLLLEFAQRYPDITLATDYSDHRTNLFEEGLDLAIRITDALEPGDIARRIGVARVIAIAAPAYLARHGEPAHPSELIRHQCLGYTVAPNAHGWTFLIDGQPKTFPVRGRLQANNGDVLLHAAMQGFGITYEPAFICADALAAGEVRQILRDYPTPQLGIYAILPANRHIPHRVTALVDFIAARLDGWKNDLE